MLPAHRSFICPKDELDLGANFTYNNCDEWVQNEHPAYVWGISTGVLLLLLGQAEIGAAFVLKLNTLIFIILMASIVLGWQVDVD